MCERPQVYAESILKVCEFCVGSRLACVSGVTGTDLKKRMVRIMTERVTRKLDFGRKLLLGATGLRSPRRSLHFWFVTRNAGSDPNLRLRTPLTRHPRSRLRPSKRASLPGWKDQDGVVLARRVR